MAGVTEEGCILYYFEMGLYSKWMRCKDVITGTKRLKIKLLYHECKAKGG